MTRIDSPPAPPPLSVAQEALWYLAVLAPRRVSYNESIAFHKDGPLDVRAVRLAFQELVRRHEAWRTTFERLGSGPVQIVHPPAPIELPILDLRHLTEAEAERQATRVTGRTAAVPYDLRRGPLVRPWLVHFPGEHHRLVLAMHHLVFDGVSLARTVLPELVALYEVFARGEVPALASPAASYADYARWEREWSSSERFERRLSWWRAHLDGAQRLPLPFDREAPTPRRFRGGIVPLRLERDELERLAALARPVGSTVFQALAAVWAVLLARICGRDEVVFATAADLRQRREFERLVGYSLTPLVLRVDLRSSPNFRELLLRVRNELLDGLDHLVPFERVVRALEQGRVADANPIYGTMMLLEPGYETPDPQWSLHQLAGEVNAVVGGSKLDLELQLDARPDGHLQGRLVYDRDLFSAATAEHLVALWVRLARAVAAAPERPVHTLPLIEPEEERRQRVEWNATSSGPERAGAHAMLGEVCRRAGERDPILTVGEQSVTLRELERLAGEAAERLRDGGLAPGAVVDVVAVPAIDTIAAAWGALQVGCAYRLLDTSTPSLDLTAAASVPADLCCVIPSTASNGEPVEVPVRHAAVVNLARALASEIGIGPRDGIVLLPQEFARRSLLLVWAGLAAGADVIVAGGEGTDGSEINGLLGGAGGSILAAAPAQWEQLLESGLRARRGLVAVTVGPGPSPGLAAQILARAHVLWCVYGQPETAFGATLGYAQRSQPFTIGRPLRNTRAHVVDPDGQPVPAGVVGELLIAGSGVTPGYLGRSGAADKRTFLPEPGGTGRAFRTGDRARWLADGELVLVR